MINASLVSVVQLSPSKDLYTYNIYLGENDFIKYDSKNTLKRIWIHNLLIYVLFLVAP